MTTNQSALWQLESEEVFAPQTVARLVVVVLVALGTAGLLLLARRLMGAFTTELPWQTAIISALLTFAIITGLRILWRRAFPEPMAGESWIGWGASLAMVLLAAGLIFPTEQSLAWLVWVPLLLLDQGIRARLFGTPTLDVPEFSTLKPTAPRLSGEQVQQIIRTRDAEGRETIRATLRADFQSGQRHATVYVGFCPPLATMPEITVECADAPGAELKIVQAFAHGARIDVRLAQTTLEDRIVVLNLVAYSWHRNDAG